MKQLTIKITKDNRGVITDWDDKLKTKKIYVVRNRYSDKIGDTELVAELIHQFSFKTLKVIKVTHPYQRNMYHKGYIKLFNPNDAVYLLDDDEYLGMML